MNMIDQITGRLELNAEALEALNVTPAKLSPDQLTRLQDVVERLMVRSHEVSVAEPYQPYESESRH